MPLVTVTVLQYQPSARFRAFANMGRVMLNPFVAEGLTFHKLLGSGHNFGLLPNFSTYVFLGVWETEPNAAQFFTSPNFSTLTQGTNSVRTIYLEPYQSHGLWDGVNPFAVSMERGALSREHGAWGVESGEAVAHTPSPMPQAPGLFPIAVLTRATVRPAALIDFWRHVPAARRRLTDYKDDLLFAIGVGERPIVQQCTISVWRNQNAVEQFAYRQSGHKEVVRQARNRHWFNEELFARFRVIKSEGFDFPL